MEGKREECIKRKEEDIEIKRLVVRKERRNKKTNRIRKKERKKERKKVLHK